MGVLVSAMPRDAVDAAAAVCGGGPAGGKLPVHVTAHLTMALCLFPDDDYTGVTTKVTGALDRFAAGSPHTGERRRVRLRRLG